MLKADMTSVLLRMASRWVRQGRIMSTTGTR